MNEAERQFLLELRALSLKHRIQIGGCGCCGSPFVAEIKPEDATDEGFYAISPDSDNLTWFGRHDESITRRKLEAVK